jgi:hypothetical protein
MRAYIGASQVWGNLYPAEFRDWYPGGWKNATGNGNCFYYALVYGLLQNAWSNENTKDAKFEHWHARSRSAVQVLNGLGYIDGQQSQSALDAVNAIWVSTPESRGPASARYFDALVWGLRLIATDEILRNCAGEAGYMNIVLADLDKGDGYQHRTAFRTLNEFFNTQVFPDKAWATERIIGALLSALRVQLRIEDVMFTRPAFSLEPALPNGTRVVFDWIYLLRMGDGHYGYIKTPKRRPPALLPIQPVSGARNRDDNVNAARVQAILNDLAQIDTNERETVASFAAYERKKMIELPGGTHELDAYYKGNVKKVKEHRAKFDVARKRLQAELQTLLNE